MDSKILNRSQSKDFGETVNLHTEMNVSNERYQSIFHNWKEPSKCAQNKRGNDCWVCSKLKTEGVVKDSSVKLLIIGDLHGRIPELLELLKTDTYKAIVCVGDLGIYADLVNAMLDKKAFVKDSYLLLNDLEKLPIPLYSIKGNHDDYSLLKSQELVDKNIFYLDQGQILQIDNLTIAGIGGIYSSMKSYFDVNTLKGVERRFFTEGEIQDLIDKNIKLDVLLTHEAAASKCVKPGEGNILLDKLVNSIDHKFYLYGHHHVNKKIDDKTIALGAISTGGSYVVINTLTRELMS